MFFFRLKQVGPGYLQLCPIAGTLWYGLSGETAVFRACATTLTPHHELLLVVGKIPDEVTG